MDTETGIKYVGFFSYKKKINGVNRKITRMVCWMDSLEEAEEAIRGRVFNNETKKVEDYFVSVYDITEDISIKLAEHKVLI